AHTPPQPSTPPAETRSYLYRAPHKYLPVRRVSHRVFANSAPGGWHVGLAGHKSGSGFRVRLPLHGAFVLPAPRTTHEGTCPWGILFPLRSTCRAPAAALLRAGLTMPALGFPAH